MGVGPEIAYIYFRVSNLIILFNLILLYYELIDIIDKLPTTNCYYVYYGLSCPTRSAKSCHGDYVLLVPELAEEPEVESCGGADSGGFGVDTHGWQPYFYIKLCLIAALQRAPATDLVGSASDSTSAAPASSFPDNLHISSCKDRHLLEGFPRRS